MPNDVQTEGKMDKNGQMSTERQEMRSHLSNNTQQSYPIFFQHPRQTICVRSDHDATLLLFDTSTCSMTWTAWDGLDIDHIKTFPEESKKIFCDFFCSLLVAVSISIQKTWQDPHTAWEPWRGGWGHKEGKLLAEYQLGTPVEGQATWPSWFKSSVGSSYWINGFKDTKGAVSDHNSATTSIGIHFLLDFHPHPSTQKFRFMFFCLHFIFTYCIWISCHSMKNAIQLSLVQLQVTNVLYDRVWVQVGAATWQPGKHQSRDQGRQKWCIFLHEELIWNPLESPKITGSTPASSNPASSWGGGCHL